MYSCTRISCDLGSLKPNSSPASTMSDSSAFSSRKGLRKYSPGSHVSCCTIRRANSASISSCDNAAILAMGSRAVTKLSGVTFLCISRLTVGCMKCCRICGKPMITSSFVSKMCIRMVAVTFSILMFTQIAPIVCCVCSVPPSLMVALPSAYSSLLFARW